MDFKGLVFRQTENAPVQVAFVAPSTQIDGFAKVPTKLSSRPHLFQRAAIPTHVTEVEKFFKDDTRSNSSPTAILLGVEPESHDRVRILEPETDVDLDLKSVTTTPQQCRISIDFSPWSPEGFKSLDEEIDKLVGEVGSLYTDVLTQDLAEVDGDEDNGVEDSDIVPTEEQSSPTQSDDDDDALQDDEEHADGDASDDFLAKLSAAELARILAEREYVGWSQKRKKDLRDQLKDDRKIGVIIDGQHRVKGTARIGKFPFLVCMLPFASWAELAFQFIVNNGTAKRVDDGLLISIVGQSLSPEELQKTEGRLYRSGIKVALIQAVMRVQTEENPFNGMLRFGIPGEEGFLDAPAVQKKVVALWYGTRGRSGTRPAFSQVRLNLEDDKKRTPWSLEEAFSHVCEGANSQERARDWQDKRWFGYFSAFWQAVSAHFQGNLWPASKDQWPGDRSTESQPVQTMRQNLMRVTVLGLLQSAVLDVWWKRDEQERRIDEPDPTKSMSVFDQAFFKKKIEKYVNRIPEAFFADLDFQGFDASKKTRGDLQEQMIRLMENNVAWAELKTSHKYWKK